MRASWLVLLAATSVLTDGEVIDYGKLGAVPDDDSLATMNNNTRIMNHGLAQMRPGDTFFVPSKTFHLNGGVAASGLMNATIMIDGIISFNSDRHTWPTQPDSKRVLESMTFSDAEHITFTSSVGGTLDGNGEPWWGAIEYLIFSENRPRLFHVTNCTQILVENLLFKNSAYWTTLFDDVSYLTIRYSNVSVHSSKAKTHDARELQAFNTDGFDVAGSNVHIHDCQIWNDDDSVCVKDLGDGGYRARCSENWLVERVNASGLGLTIGSIGSSAQGTCVRNITFRDSTMYNTFKGIYMKTRHGDPTSNHTAIIEDILYENITMYKPEQWAIWIGPAQQADSSGDCSLLWPTDPFAECNIGIVSSWNNIVLRDIFIHEPKNSPGVVIGNISHPMTNIVFDNVVVTGGSDKPWGSDGYACYGVVNGTAIGGTSPVPVCFNGGRQCLKAGTCRTRAATPCCSGKSHRTLECGIFEKCD